MTPDETIATAKLEEAKADFAEKRQELEQDIELYTRAPAGLSALDLERTMLAFYKAGQEVLVAQAEAEKARG
jgi:hypothetical protein